MAGRLSFSLGGYAMPEPTKLEELAKLRHGEPRTAELVALAANLLAGLAVVAAADLDGTEEPDFLDAATE
jgi:hypothetical protein